MEKKKLKEIISIIASTCSSYPVLDLNNLKFGFSIFTVSSRRCMVTIFVGTDDATATIGQTESSSEITLYRMQPKLRADGSTLVNAGDPEAELGSPDDLGNVARGLQVEELGHLKVDRDSLDHCIIHYHVLAAFAPNFKMIYDDQRNMHNITYKKGKKGEKMRMVFRLSFTKKHFIQHRLIKGHYLHWSTFSMPQASPSRPVRSARTICKNS